MSRSSEYFELVLVGFVAAFAYLFQPIFEHLFAGALMAWLEKSMRPSEAEVIAHLSEIALPIIGLVLLIWALCRFLRREMERRFINEDARLELAKLRNALWLAGARTSSSCLCHLKRGKGRSTTAGWNALRGCAFFLLSALPWRS